MYFPTRFLALFRVAAAAFLFVASSMSAQQREIRIAAASDLQFAMPELARQFESQSGVKVTPSFGSSGNFTTQIQNGAPFDLFFSADIDYPRKLDSAGLVEPGSIFEYAEGKIVMWAPKDSQLDLSKGWDVLLEARTQKIAVANPEHAPYGRAAVAALKSANVFEKVQSKIVYGENISQTAQFVQSGNAQVGFVALSLAVSPAMKDGKQWVVPNGLYPPLQQAVAIMKASKDKESDKAFLEFVKGDAGRQILAKYGFSLPAR